MFNRVMSTVKVQESYQLKNVKEQSEKRRSLLRRDIFTDDEKLLYESRSIIWLYLISPILLSILGLLILPLNDWLPLASINNVLKLPLTDMLVHNIIDWFGLTVCAIGVLAIIIRWLRWIFTVYVITDHRIIRQAGILDRSYLDCSFRNIQTTHLHISLLGRILGFGTITISDNVGPSLAEIHWKHIKNPVNAYRRLAEAIDLYR